MSCFIKKINWKSIIIWLFPTLFLIDDILGFNGYQFTIGGKSIRIILFCLTTAILFSYCLWVVLKKKITIFKRKPEKEFLFDYIKPLDYMVLAFVFFNLIWATVVPLMVRGNITFALKDFSTILVLILYFPIVFLMRVGLLEYKKLEKAIYILLILLAGWHTVMYVGETISPGFYESYYDFIDIISFGTAVRSDVVIGYGITRIIQVTSPLLLLGGILSAKYVANRKYWNLLPLVLFCFAICVTYTKSIWFGFVFGVAIYLIGNLFLSSGKKEKLHIAAVIAFIVSIIISLNYFAFNNTIFQRVLNSAPTTSSDGTRKEVQDLYERLKELQALGDSDEYREEIEKILAEIKAKENAIKDIEGTILSNELRSRQMKALFNKWEQSKWVGFGYGAYVEDCIRNSSAPYMYESLLPAMIMKLGIVGFIPWFALITFAIIAGVLRYWKKDKKNLLWWIGASVAFGLAIQTNPFLFTFAGFSMVLFILIFVNSNLSTKNN